jgi:hypothetical protein
VGQGRGGGEDPEAVGGAVCALSDRRRAAIGSGWGMELDRALLVMLFVAAVAVGVAGCSEKPPRPNPERAQLYNGTDGDSPLKERTLKQGEPSTTERGAK